MKHKLTTNGIVKSIHDVIKNIAIKQLCNGLTMITFETSSIARPFVEVDVIHDKSINKWFIDITPINLFTGDNKWDRYYEHKDWFSLILEFDLDANSKQEYTFFVNNKNRKYTVLMLEDES